MGHSSNINERYYQQSQHIHEVTRLAKMLFDVEDRLQTASSSDHNEAEIALNREEEENISVNDLFEERQEDVSDQY